MFLTIFLGLILIGFFYILKVLTSTRGIVESFGIPYVKPFLIFGSPPFLLHKIIVSEYFLKQCKELGRTWGYYNGQTPTIVTIDPDFIKQVTVKQFDNFSMTFAIPNLPDNQKTLDLVPRFEIFVIETEFHLHGVNFELEFWDKNLQNRP